MSTNELWMLVAALLAFAAGVCYLLSTPPLTRLAPALLSGAVGVLAVGFLLAFP
jgi:uncharacterized membrane protein HdeD (DUF308 family)